MNLHSIRKHFPALERELHGRNVIYLDGPAGTQVPKEVISSISDYYRYSNANTHGQFASSQETDRIMESARNKVATFINAPDANCISFGQNMTTLNFSLSKALVRDMNPGDEILITQLDHEANRGPWLNLEERGIIIKEVSLKPEGVLDYEDLERKLSERTKLVCIGYASNMIGTVNDVKYVRSLTRDRNIRMLIDAVHFAPHMAIDVQALDCDFLLCSAYKFYGPHVGILYCKPGLLNTLQTDRLRTQSADAPYRIETGTLNHAAIAGVEAAIKFISRLGEGKTLRDKITSAMQTIHRHEMDLAAILYDGLQQIKGCTIYGPGMESGLRTPTLGFSIKGITPEKVCYELAKQAIYAWDGHFYAIRAAEVLDLMKTGGVTRMGIVAYNTKEEINRTVKVMEKIASDSR
ncbi:MAG: cysteine desulfurase-like protein [Saprospiraceae bacterium]|nr:cysteine desulfurase-like protein [Saprospiraceae bacterium]